MGTGGLPTARPLLRLYLRISNLFEVGPTAVLPVDAGEVKPFCSLLRLAEVYHVWSLGLGAGCRWRTSRRVQWMAWRRRHDIANQGRDFFSQELLEDD